MADDPAVVDELTYLHSRMADFEGTATIQIVRAGRLHQRRVVLDLLLDEILRLRNATNEGTITQRMQRVVEIIREARGNPVPGAVPFFTGDLALDAD